MKRIALSAAVLVALGTPALAGQCPALIGKLDAAMASATVDDATRAKIQDLYATGKSAHENGDHAASVTALNEALALLAG